MADIQEAKNKITLTYGLFAYIIMSVGFVAGGGMTIYWNFKASEMEIMELRERIEYVDGRINKKTDRNKEFIDGLEKRVDFLELPGSDDTSK